jgi:DNA-binding LacI/PurR family transcriptional regulator
MARSDAGRSRVTLVDIARATQVSRQTVSNVLNNPDRVAPDTAARVQAEIDRTGFRPSGAAQSLRWHRANTIGIELNFSGDRRLSEVVSAFLVELTLAARRQNAHVVVFSTASDDDPVVEYDRLLSSRLVDGFVLVDSRHDDPRPEWLSSRRVPFVSFGRAWDDPQFTTWIDVDGHKGTVRAVQHLADRGYDPIGFLGWPPGSAVGDDRRAGWLEATGHLAMLQPDLQAAAPQQLMAAQKAAEELITRIGPGGGLVCASDTLAAGAIQAIKAAGLQPGLDIGVVGFDDTETAEAFDLTTLAQPLPQIADNLLVLLAAIESGTPPPPQGQLLPAQLITRLSTQPQKSHRAASSVAPDNTAAGDRAQTGGTK